MFMTKSTGLYFPSIDLANQPTICHAKLRQKYNEVKELHDVAVDLRQKFLSFLWYDENNGMIAMTVVGWTPIVLRAVEFKERHCQ